MIQVMDVNQVKVHVESDQVVFIQVVTVQVVTVQVVTVQVVTVQVLAQNNVNHRTSHGLPRCEEPIFAL
jgi:hypothetical protein